MPSFQEQIVQAIEARADAAAILGIPLPETMRAVTTHKDEAGMFEGLDSADKDPRKALHLDEVPVLVPTAMAAGALFMVVLQETRLPVGQGNERTRAVSVQQSVRVTAPETIVRSKPDPRADEIATVARGTMVAVTDEERNWLRVDLHEGRTGWVERRAFE